MPKFGVPQITLEGSRDQNLRGGGHSVPSPPDKVGLMELLSSLAPGDFQVSSKMSQVFITDQDDGGAL